MTILYNGGFPPPPAVEPPGPEDDVDRDAMVGWLRDAASASASASASVGCLFDDAQECVSASFFLFTFRSVLTLGFVPFFGLFLLVFFFFFNS